MKKSFYILGFAAMLFVGCDKSSDFDTDSRGLKTTPVVTPKDTTTQDTIKWDCVMGKSLPIDSNMVATPWIKYEKNGKSDSVQMESWLLDINTTDLVVYRDSYRPTTKSGITPNAEHSDDPEFMDKFGNMVTRHHYTQAFRFNNFDHKINGSWNTGYLYVKGKREAFLPEDGLYYDLANISIADTTHFVRNDSIYASEVIKLTYKATLREEAGKPKTWRSWERTATVTVISFVGLVEKPIPGADNYIPNLKWHAERANRFENGIGMWCDGVLFSSSTEWYMLVTTFNVTHNGEKEEPIETKLDSIAKSEMVNPVAGREFNGVMWDTQRNKYVPCHIEVNGDGWILTSRYADGLGVSKVHNRNEAVMGGVKNPTEDTSTPTPWITSSWTESQYNGKNFYSVTVKTKTHTMSHSIADSALQK